MRPPERWEGGKGVCISLAKRRRRKKKGRGKEENEKRKWIMADTRIIFSPVQISPFVEREGGARGWNRNEERTKEKIPRGGGGMGKSVGKGEYDTRF